MKNYLSKYFEIVSEKPEAIEIIPASTQTKIVMELLPVWAVITPILKKTPAPITDPTTVANA